MTPSFITTSMSSNNQQDWCKYRFTFRNSRSLRAVLRFSAATIDCEYRCLGRSYIVVFIACDYWMWWQIQRGTSPVEFKFLTHPQIYCLVVNRFRCSRVSRGFYGKVVLANNFILDKSRTRLFYGKFYLLCDRLIDPVRPFSSARFEEMWFLHSGISRSSDMFVK